MILVGGIPSEPPVALLLDALRANGTEHLLFNQREVARWTLRARADERGLHGELTRDGERHALERVTGVYTRLMDDRLLPELADEPPSSAARAHARALHDTLATWIQLTPACVVNRPSAMLSNSSKPYQAQLIARCGFHTPPTLVTNDPARVLAFREAHGRVIYKSVSAVRSIVRELDDADLERLELIRWCPTQFQAWVPGVDVRVHVIGEELFATEIATTGVDYRYASGEGGETTLRPIELPAELAARCRRLTRELELEFSGIDLRLHRGRAVCFEVNASPGYSYYEAHTGQPISAALARHLAAAGVRTRAAARAG